MKGEAEAENTASAKRPRKRGRKRAIVAILAVLAGAYWFLRPGPEDTTAKSGTTAVVKRAPLLITVNEGGSIEALESQEVKSDVRGETKILKIIEEGHVITQEEIDKGFVLVEMDAEKFKDDKTERELAYQTALASDVEAQKRYEIQVNDNESALASAKLAVKFARMDFDRYLGENGHLFDLLSHVNHPNRKGHQLVADEILRYFPAQ